MRVMDEFVMMRLAQMIREGLVEEAIERALRQHGGNFGSQVLEKNAEKLGTALGEIQLEDPDPL